MKGTYKPQEGSFAYQVIEFLTTNPDEQLTSDDAGTKFDRPSKQVHSLLAPAVDCGALIRAEAEDGLVYRLGTGVPSIKPSAARHPSLQPGPGVVATPRPRKPLSREIDLSAVTIEDNIPMPTGRRAPMDWTPLLDKMKPGQSCVLPITTRSTLAKAMKDAKDAKRGEYSLRQLNDDELRVWRVS